MHHGHCEPLVPCPCLLISYVEYSIPLRTIGKSDAVFSILDLIGHFENSGGKVAKLEDFAEGHYGNARM